MFLNEADFDVTEAHKQGPAELFPACKIEKICICALFFSTAMLRTRNSKFFNSSCMYCIFFWSRKHFAFCEKFKQAIVPEAGGKKSCNWSDILIFANGGKLDKKICRIYYYGGNSSGHFCLTVDCNVFSCLFRRFFPCTVLLMDRWIAKCKAV